MEKYKQFLKTKIYFTYSGAFISKSFILFFIILKHLFSSPLVSFLLFLILTNFHYTIIKLAVKLLTFNSYNKNKLNYTETKPRHNQMYQQNLKIIKKINFP